MSFTKQNNDKLLHERRHFAFASLSFCPFYRYIYAAINTVMLMEYELKTVRPEGKQNRKFNKTMISLEDETVSEIYDIDNISANVNI